MDWEPQRTNAPPMDWEAQRPSAPSTPTSVSSHSTSGTGSSKEKIPTFKPLNPSPTVTALSKIPNEELFRKGPNELLNILRRVEADYKSLLSEHSNVIKDVNRRFQIFVLETRGLKDINQKLQDDNQELRDLCCFLDDDRQRSRKLAREWQRFGRYTASVMHSEVAAYQEKLHQLEERQAELLSDNMELKELCLFLDHERAQMNGDRDDGDGSSNGTMPGHEEMGQSHADSDGQTTPTPTPTPLQQGNEASAAYVRQLELKIQRLEEEKKQLAQRVERNGADGYHPADQDGTGRRLDTNLDQVLQVHEQLERPRDPVGTEDLGDPEKAIVREMCNVVWRKLGDVGEYPPHTATGDTYAAAVPAPATVQPFRPQSAAGNPVVLAGPTRLQPPSHSLPTSPTEPGHHSARGNFRPATAHAGSPGDESGPSSLGSLSGGYTNERRSQLPVGQRPGAAPPSVHVPGGREGYGHGGGGGGYGHGGGGRDHGPVQVGGGRDNFPVPGGRDFPGGGGGGGRENFPGQKGSRAHQGPVFAQPAIPASSQATERPRHTQPPPYSSAKGNVVPSSRSAPNPNPPLYHPSQQLPQPHHQAPPPSSRPSQQPPPPRYQQRTHPFHGNQGQPAPSQGQPFPRSASSSATYYVSHPTSQAKSPSAPVLPSHPHPAPTSSVPGVSYLYSQRGPGGGMAQPPLFRSYPGGGDDQGPRSGPDQGRGEWKQTYLDE
ncbi:coiled-coil domain-containing protein 85A-like isoform X2 [Littorina saxatilis]|uniref:coiled-coil domain-containing protein 85A-like isoform X2 n=1 Tax=Littorina saxatilis TaxID=31220 RepID=UPI0038B53554